ncbi:putative lipid II flippase FtsW [Ectothiorhodospiraceae bacterium BW-2]|nr:putative lipid II flippase FtsW [Ectothiorhodospiraceae bacterium BW-2]
MALKLLQQMAVDAIDRQLLLLGIGLSLFGVLMVASASVGIGERLAGDSGYFMQRQAIYLLISLGLALAVWRIPLQVLETLSPLLFLVAIVLLLAVFIPGLGRTVNGSTRWLNLGLINFQVSEFAKLALILYLSGYIVRRQQPLREQFSAFLRPMLLVMVAALLLILEPDFGSVVVILATAMGMLFLAGVRIWIFASAGLVAMAGLALLAFTSPYRLERLQSYLDPWSDQYGSGYQLTQALIAFGRGDWIGAGLGSSVQKLFYLPEAHTDFVYAVVAEELGVLGAALLLLLFGWLIARLFIIGQRAMSQRLIFGGYLCYGIAIWLALQTIINMGVNMGLLPTKGLSLPLLSYGGSNLLMIFIALALVMRVVTETAQAERRS